MDGIDGDELDAQELLDKMAEMGVIEEGITVDNGAGRTAPDGRISPP